MTSHEQAEIDAWDAKTDAVFNAIKGLKDGSLDPNTLSLKQYGILNEQEKKQEEQRKERLQQEALKQQLRERQLEKEKWWRGAKQRKGDWSDHEEPDKEDHYELVGGIVFLLYQIDN